jgi:hypothetical protein
MRTKDIHVLDIHHENGFGIMEQVDWIIKENGAWRDFLPSISNIHSLL